MFLPLSSLDRWSRMGFTCNNCQLDVVFVDKTDIYVLFQEGLFNMRVYDITAADIPISYPSPLINIGAASEIRAFLVPPLN